MFNRRNSHFDLSTQGMGAQHPGEPLYSMEECAERLKCSKGALYGLKPWRQNGGRRLYRLSDAKAFLRKT